MGSHTLLTTSPSPEALSSRARFTTSTSTPAAARCATVKFPPTALNKAAHSWGCCIAWRRRGSIGWNIWEGLPASGCTYARHSVLYACCLITDAPGCAAPSMSAEPRTACWPCWLGSQRQKGLRTSQQFAPVRPQCWAAACGGTHHLASRQQSQSLPPMPPSEQRQCPAWYACCRDGQQAVGLQK